MNQIADTVPYNTQESLCVAPASAGTKDSAPLHIRLGQAPDLSAACSIIEAARDYFKRSGIDQWQDDSAPDRAALVRDLQAACWYVAEQNGRVVATFMAALADDASYATITDGAWLTQGTPYAVLHRIAIDEACKGCGIGAQILQFMAQQFAPQGARSLRGDTHADNVSMRRMLEKSGFLRCGVIYLKEGVPRDAFEMALPHAAAPDAQRTHERNDKL